MVDTDRALGRMIDTRAPKSALLSPVTTNLAGQPISPDWDEDRYIERGYLDQVYVYKCVEKIANSIAGCDFRAGSNPDNPTKFVQSAALAALLGPAPGQPNPAWTARQMWKYIITQYLLLGKFALQIERGPLGNIIALWALQAQHLRPLPNLTGRGDSFFNGFEYGYRGQPGFKVFRNEELVYCYKPSQKDHRVPETVLQAAGLDVSVLQLMDSYDYSMLKNNGVPSTIVTTEPFVDGNQRSAFRNQFLNRFSGAGNQGKTLFLEADSDVNQDGVASNNVSSKISVERLGMTAVEMQSEEQKKSRIDNICVAFSTPMSILGVSSSTKFANGEGDYRTWWTETLLPLMDELTDLINTNLAPQLPQGYRGWFDVSKVGALQKTTRFALGDLTTMEEKNILTRDEVRAEMGLLPWDEVDHPEVEEKAEAFKAQQELAPAQPIQATVEQPAIVQDRPKLALTAGKSIPQNVNAALASSLRRSMQLQHKGVTDRASGRRAANVDSLADHFDETYWLREMATDIKTIAPVLSMYGPMPTERWATMLRTLVQDTKTRLASATTVDEAYSDMDTRCAQTANEMVRLLEEVPTALILDAVAKNKITPQAALEMIA